MNNDTDRFFETGSDPLDHDGQPPLIDEVSMPTLTQNGLRQLLRERIGLSHSESRELVEALFETVTAELATGRSVRLSGFGNFDVHVKRARPGRNPRTGEDAEVPARQTVKFAPGGKLRRQMRGPLATAPETATASSPSATTVKSLHRAPAASA